jgi:hypothetical protein
MITSKAFHKVTFTGARCESFVLAKPGVSSRPMPTITKRSFKTLPWLAVFGPGLVVMLADTDVGSIITAGQSGVEWGYKLLIPQFILMPVLYIVQELTVRLGIFTGRGHGELIREAFGPVWAWVSAALYFIALGGGGAAGGGAHWLLPPGRAHRHRGGAV